jgi:hypothetical protein
MGRLGWGADQALDTPMVYIHAALQDREEAVDRILRCLLGVPDDDAPSEKVQEASLNNAFEIFKRLGEENAKKRKKSPRDWE